MVIALDLSKQRELAKFMYQHLAKTATVYLMVMIVAEVGHINLHHDVCQQLPGTCFEGGPTRIISENRQAGEDGEDAGIKIPPR